MQDFFQRISKLLLKKFKFGFLWLSEAFERTFYTTYKSISNALIIMYDLINFNHSYNAL